MARILKDNDDDFPEVSQLKKPSKATAVKESIVKSGARRYTDLKGDRESKEDFNKDECNPTKTGGSTLKLKKRLLNQATDNPLLRPVTGKSSRSAKPATTEKLGAFSTSRCNDTQPQATAEDVAQDRRLPVLQGVRRLLPQRNGERVRTSGWQTKKDSQVKKTDWESGSDHETINLDDSDDLSDFVVNDSSDLEEEDSVIEKPPPRSTRKLVRGRRPTAIEDSDDEDLNFNLQRLTVKDRQHTGQDEERDTEGSLKLVPELLGWEQSVRQDQPQSSMFSPKQNAQNQVSDKSAREPTTSSHDPFTLRFSPSENKVRTSVKVAQIVTPPASPEPKSRGLKSPTKAFARIPMTPHRPSMDLFWQPDVINDWNDEYSPQKTLQSPRKLSVVEHDPMDKLRSPKKNPVKQDRAAKELKKSFSESKHALAQDFLIELDNKITQGEISTLAAGTGGVKIIWSKKLNTTAGRAHWKRETIRSKLCLGDGTLAPPTQRHHASIELAEKVIDDEDRLLNVIAHEFCHLANFMVSNIKTNPHGKEFKAWAAKCSQHFGHRGIEVTTKHSYAIDYKYVWECENCGVEFKRHSKSIDPARHTCGSCKSRLVQTKPVPRAAPGTAKKVSEYQLFVKEHMSRVRQENPGSPQKEIMGLLGKSYQEYKASKLLEKSLESVTIDEVAPASKEGTPLDEDEDEEPGFVERKLNFMDLTSP